MGNQLYKWVLGHYMGFQVTACMLLQEPYDGVVVEFGDETKIYEHGLEFMWRIIDNPNDVPNLTAQNTEFAKYLERVVYDRLDEAQGVADGQKEASVDGSGTG